jgi:hypothetical protein
MASTSGVGKGPKVPMHQYKKAPKSKLISNFSAIIKASTTGSGSPRTLKGRVVVQRADQESKVLSKKIKGKK